MPLDRRPVGREHLLARGGEVLEDLGVALDHRIQGRPGLGRQRGRRGAHPEPGAELAELLGDGVGEAAQLLRGVARLRAVTLPAPALLGGEILLTGGGPGVGVGALDGLGGLGARPGGVIDRVVLGVAHRRAS
jgi:hypothetical protein